MARQILNRSFSTREKVLLLILAIIAVAALYYFAVVKNVADTQAANSAKMDTLSAQIAIEEAKAANYEQMKKELETLGSVEDLPLIAVYDNVRNELETLNSMLARTSAYNISFNQPTVSDTTVRREVALTFTTGTYHEALGVVSDLANGTYRCNVVELSMAGKMLANGDIESVSTSLKAVFYETTEGAASLNGLTDVS